MAIVCTKCEREVEEDAKFCPKCGHPTPKGTAINAFTMEEHRAMVDAFMQYQREQRGLPEPEPRTLEMDGIPAITPHLSTDDPSLPTYTAEDAIAFTLAHPPSRVQRIKSVTAEDITVKFMPDAEADKLLNNICIGQPADHVVCVVQVHGPFLTPGIVAPNFGLGPVIPSGAVHMTYLGYTYRVFSRIGHLLVETGSQWPYLQ